MGIFKRIGNAIKNVTTRVSDTINHAITTVGGVANNAINSRTQNVANRQAARADRVASRADARVGKEAYIQAGNAVAYQHGQQPQDRPGTAWANMLGQVLPGIAATVGGAIAGVPAFGGSSPIGTVGGIAGQAGSTATSPIAYDNNGIPYSPHMRPTLMDTLRQNPLIALGIAAIAFFAIRAGNNNRSRRGRD